MGGQAVKAYVLLTVEIGKEYDIAREIRSLNVNAEIDVDVVYGEYDLVVRLETGNLKDVDKVVTKIRGMPGVLKTVTLIAS